MRIGVPRETKNHEYRVGLVPSSVLELTQRGHEVWVERGAGLGAGIRDEDFEATGARVLPTAREIFEGAEMIVKVKEPLPAERAMLRPGQILFTYLHLAPDPAQTRELMASGAVCIAYETVTAPNGSLPLLTPMSEVAGRLAPQVGAHALEKAQGGRGVLLGGVPGVPGADVVILGGGVSGSHAAAIAHGLGARVTVVDRSTEALKRLSLQFGGAVSTVFSTRAAIAELVRRADLLIGTVLVPGAAAPKLVTRDMVRTMKPGAVARTSTFALNNVTLPFVLALAEKGWKQALTDDPHLRNGLNVAAGQVTLAPVAQAHGVPMMPAEQLLAT